MKGAQRILLILVVSGILLFLGRGVLLKGALSAGVKAVTGLPLQIERVNVDLLRSKMEVQGLRLLNPPAFPDRVMADLPELYVHCDPKALLSGKVHLRELDIYLRELVVVRNRQGQLNLDSITAVQQAKARGKVKADRSGQKPQAQPLKIDRLHLRIGEVIYKDYALGGEPLVQEFSIQLDERYQDIPDPTALGSLIIARALFHTSIARLANFDLESLNRVVQGTGKQIFDATLKKLLPILGEDDRMGRQP